MENTTVCLTGRNCRERDIQNGGKCRLPLGEIFLEIWTSRRQQVDGDGEAMDSSLKGDNGRDKVARVHLPRSVCVGASYKTLFPAGILALCQATSCIHEGIDGCGQAITLLLATGY